ncbi:MAG: hypothetical protein KAS70_00815 [Planctomycetes bacterium]|nr:hypothetical protein [Planctomycetota bacterium]
MERKWLLVITGFFLGGLFVMGGMFMTHQLLMAQTTPANINTGSAGEFIVLTTNDTKGHTLLWIMDTRNKNLSLYDYDSSNVKFSWSRDVQFDLDIPEGQVYVSKGHNKTPYAIKKIFDAWAKKAETE